MKPMGGLIVSCSQQMFGLGRPRKVHSDVHSVLQHSEVIQRAKNVCVPAWVCVFKFSDAYVFIHTRAPLADCVLVRFEDVNQMLEAGGSLCPFFLVCLTRGQDRKPAHTTRCPHGNLSVACGTFTVSGLLKTETVRWMGTSHQCICVSKRQCLFTGVIFEYQSRFIR